MATLKTDEPAIRSQSLQNKWLAEHQIKMNRLIQTLAELDSRFASFGEKIEQRITSDEYLDIVRKAFRIWDESDTNEKRKYVANLMANSAGTQLCTDDVIRLFIDWLRIYHEAHFSIISKIYNEPGVTRYQIWHELRGELPREDSADADLYRLLIRDLSMGGVIRQARETTEDGRFLKRERSSARGQSSTMESAFEETKQYLLTELGKQFVHYTMTDLVKRIEESKADS